MYTYILQVIGIVHRQRCAACTMQLDPAPCNWTLHHVPCTRQLVISCVLPPLQQAAKLLADKKTILLKLDGHKPAQQVKLDYDLESADGDELIGNIHSTIHKVPAK